MEYSHSKVEITRLKAQGKGLKALSPGPFALCHHENLLNLTIRSQIQTNQKYFLECYLDYDIEKLKVQISHR